MKDIFADLYNKVLKFFNKADEPVEHAKDVACNRLKLVLMQDRTNLSPAIMDRMRRELIELLSKYMELDRELLDLSFEHEDEQMALMLSIPVLRAKTEEEIQSILDKEDEEKTQKEDSEGETDEDESEENSDEDIENNSDSDDNDDSEEDNNSSEEEDEDDESEDDESEDDESDDGDETDDDESAEDDEEKNESETDVQPDKRKKKH